MKPRMLITGGYGFVGSALTNVARQSFDVLLISRTRRRQYDIVWDMMGRPPKLPAVQFVVHLASATAKSSLDTTTLTTYRKFNVETTKNLLSSLTNKPDYILYVSTADVYDKKNPMPINETVPTNPTTAYAKSKLEAEHIVTSYCRPHDIPSGIARLGLIYGPGEQAYQKAIPVFIQKAFAHQPIELIGNGRVKRQFLYVDDCANALMCILHTKTPGIVNVAGAHSISIAGVAAIINQLTQNPAGVTHIDSRHPQYDVLYDCRKLASMGFCETITLTEGLRREIDHARFF